MNLLTVDRAIMLVRDLDKYTNSCPGKKSAVCADMQTVSYGTEAATLVAGSLGHQIFPFLQMSALAFFAASRKFYMRHILQRTTIFFTVPSDCNCRDASAHPRRSSCDLQGENSRLADWDKAAIQLLRGRCPEAARPGHAGPLLL
ncbi:hypothetical protein AK812_SmicGene6961 [Symbiodinium microadriaticum]|uniref:Uncharacterized protein n=1 Tax=Symbiodinium microadriaticum TaxID=2951 RepID=A0A1Q9EPT2_SYMMI|nr:hypothetical protein AK812_SmicGene6961 [Symbiodinium microadriaticum]